MPPGPGDQANHNDSLLKGLMLLCAVARKSQRTSFDSLSGQLLRMRSSELLSIATAKPLGAAELGCARAIAIATRTFVKRSRQIPLCDNIHHLSFPISTSHIIYQSPPTFKSNIIPP